MYSVFMRANINNTNEERESFDASFFVGGGERSFFFWMDFAMHGANKKFTKAFHLQKEVTVTQKGMATFRQPLFPRQTHRRIEEIAFCVFGF